MTDPKENRGTGLEKNKWVEDLTECLRTYDALGLWRDAEDVIRKELVRPFVKKVLYIGGNFDKLLIQYKDSPPQCTSYAPLAYCAAHTISSF